MSNIINAKVKFVRNLKDRHFNCNSSDIEQKQVLDLLVKTINDCGFKSENLSNVGKSVIENLLCNDLLEQEFVSNYTNQGLVNIDNATIQINGANHIEIFAKDSNVYDAYVKAKEIDKLLCNKLSFAYSDKYGFLTPNVKNIGSGISVEVKIMLPALAQIGALNKIPKFNDKLIFDIVCLDINSGLCIISSNATLGYSEKQICELVTKYLNNIIKLEIETSKQLASQDIDDVKDKLFRAEAILNNCIKISSVEAYQLVGNILIAINADIKGSISGQKINKVLNTINLNETDFKNLAQNVQKILKG